VRLAAHLAEHRDRGRLHGPPGAHVDGGELVDERLVVVAGGEPHEQFAGRRGERGPTLFQEPPDHPAADGDRAENQDGGQQRDDRERGGAGKGHALARASTASTRLTSSLGLNGLTT
jgi:hypothetical protein